MKTRLSILAAVVSVAVVGAFMSSAKLSQAQVDEDVAPTMIPDSDPQGAVLVGTLRGRDFAVHLYTDALYSIEDASGEIVGVHLTESEFAEQLPELYEQTQDTFAEAIADNLGRRETLPFEPSGRLP